MVLKKGKNNIPLINDFIFKTESGVDTTEAVLSRQGEYYLLFIKDAGLLTKDKTDDQKLITTLIEKEKQVFVVSSERKNAQERYGSLAVGGKQLNVPILTCDVTALKTVARNEVTLYLMKGPIVKNKWGGSDIEKAMQ